MTLDNLRQKIYFLTSTNSSSFPDAKLVVEVNNAFDRVVSLIHASDGRWEWDDSNNTDLPIATTALVANQQDYTLSTDHLQITRVEYKDNAASPNWHLLMPIDQADIYNQSLTDYLKTASNPVYYDKIGNSVFLYPMPSFSQSASLKVYFKRGPNYFTTSDTTKAPGFNTLYHDLLALWPSYNYALANDKSNGNALLAQINLKEDALREEYALRSKEDTPRLRAAPYSWR